MVLKRAASPASSGEPDDAFGNRHGVGPEAPSRGADQSDATVHVGGARAVDNAVGTADPAAPEGADHAAALTDGSAEAALGEAAALAEAAPAEAALAEAAPAEAALAEAGPAVEAPPVEAPSGGPAAGGASPGASPAEPRPAQQVLDPRAIARASLEAGRNASLWWTSAGVVVAMLVALVVGTRAGAYTLAAVLAACAVVRGVLPHPGPVGISVRAKAIDLTVLGVLAVSIAVLAQLLPGDTI
jgi:hypothetical protein